MRPQRNGTQRRTPSLVRPICSKNIIQNECCLYNLQDFINTLDSLTIKKLCIRSLRWGIGSLDYIDSLLIMEDNDKDNDNDKVDIAEAHSPATEASIAMTPPLQPIPLQGQGPRPEWCVCGNCRNVPLEVEKLCCRKKNCDAKKPRFKKSVFGPSLSSTVSKKQCKRKRKARRKVAPSCDVWKIREHYPFSTGIYMGLKE